MFGNFTAFYINLLYVLNQTINCSINIENTEHAFMLFYDKIWTYDSTNNRIK